MITSYTYPTHATTYNKEVKKHVDLIIYSYPVSLSLCCLRLLMTGIHNTVLAYTDHDSAFILLRESGGKPDDDDRRVGRHAE